MERFSFPYYKKTNVYVAESFRIPFMWRTEVLRYDAFEVNVLCRGNLQVSMRVMPERSQLNTCGDKFNRASKTGKLRGFPQ